MQIKEILVNKMKQKGWTAVKTAERANIPVPTINNIIYGKSQGNHRTIKKLSTAFGCSINDFLMENQESQNFDSQIFRYCLDKLDFFVKDKEITLSQERSMEIITKLTSLCKKKKMKNLPYDLDNETIEWIIENS